MKERKDTTKLKLYYYVFIILAAAGILISSFWGYREMERAPLYIILGICIFGDSLFQIFRTATSD